MNRANSASYRFLLAGLCVASAACAQNPTREATAFTPDQAIERSAFFDGKIIDVDGWLIAGFEDRGIWTDLRPHDHPEFDNGKQCVSLLIPKVRESEFKQLSRTRVRLRGRFHADFREMNASVVFGLCNKAVLEVLSVESMGAD